MTRHILSPGLKGLGCALVGAAAFLGGCASPRVDAQWVAPQNGAATPLRGGKILVSCSAYEVVLQRICQDQFSAEVTARGATPVVVAESAQVPIGTVPSPEAELSAARSAGARAVLSAVITTAVSDVGSGSGVSFGIGGFGFGGGRSGVGGGIGVSAPIGGGNGQVTSGYSANGKLTNAASGQLMWTAKATTAPSSDVNAQLATLAKTLLDSAEKSGVL